VSEAAGTRFDLDFLPPPDNHKFVRVRGAHWIPSPRYRDFLADLAALWRKLRLATVHGWVVIEVGVRFPDRRRRDASNLLKALLDGLVHCQAIDDDSFALVRVMSVKRVPDDGGTEGLTIAITPAPAASIPREGQLPR
jgi:Holliday junction resolvase RusA-like endonuclease